MKLVLELDGESIPVEITREKGDRYRVLFEDRDLSISVLHLDSHFLMMRLLSTPIRAQLRSTRESQHVALGGEFYDFQVIRDEGRRGKGRRGGKANGTVSSPMPGKVTKVLAAKGDSVSAGDPLLIVEAMKMENEIRAPVDGTIISFEATVGQMVMPTDTLVEIETADSPPDQP